VAVSDGGDDGDPHGEAVAGEAVNRGPWTVNRGPCTEDREPWTVHRAPRTEDREGT